MTLQSLKQNKLVYISILILVLSLVGSYLLLTNLTTTRWGELFEPHDIDKTLPVSPTFSYTQSFPAEFRYVKGILLDIAEPAPDSQIQVTARSGQGEQSSSSSLSHALNTGQLYIQFSHPLLVGQNQPVELTVSHLSGPNTNLRFQINDRPYPNGELTRLNHDTNTVQPHSGNIAFRVQYLATYAEQTKITTPAYVMLSLIAFFAWLLYLHFQSTTLPFPSLKWQIKDTLISAALFIILSGLVLFQFIPGLTDLPVMHDFTKDILYLDSATKAYTSGHLPYWHHSTCGGQPLLGNPETNIISLSTFLAPFTGPVVGLKLMLALEVGLMAVGTYLLGRMLGLSPVGAIAPALFLSLSGYVANRIYLGHTNYVGGLAYLPWAVFTWLKGLQQRRWLVITSFILLFTLLRGDTHSLTYLLILLAIWTIWFTIYRRTLHPLKALLIITIFFVLLSLPKTLPTLASSDHFHDDLPQFFVPLISQGIFADTFLDDSEELPPINLVDGEAENWENVGLHIGLLAVALTLLGLIAAPRPTALLLGATIVTFLILGEGTVYDKLIQPLPLINTVLRLPSRLLIIAILSGGISAGWLFDYLARHRTILSTAAVILLLFLLFDDMGSYAREIIGRTEFIPADQTINHSIPQSLPYDQRDSKQHTITLVSRGSTVPGLCLDFNQEPPFNTSQSTPLAMDAIGNPINSTLTPNQITIYHPSSHQPALLHLVDSNNLSITNGYRLPLNKEKLLPIAAQNADEPIILSYTSRSLWPGLIIALGIIAALLTMPPYKSDS